MACEDLCEWVRWEADRPRLFRWTAVEPGCASILPATIPAPLEDQLSANVMNENSGVTQLGCADCDCVEVGPELLVLTTEKYRIATAPWTAPNGTQCTILATFKVRLRKWRTPGECAPPDVFGA